MKETPVTRPWRVFGFALAAVALFSLMSLFVKLATASHSVIEVMFFRNALAVVPVLMLIQAHPDGFRLLRTMRPLGHLLRGAVGTVSMTFVFWSFSLLPLADAGLRDLGMSSYARDRYLGVIEQRCLSGQTGAVWQRRTVAALQEAGADRPAALRGMLRRYLDNALAGDPVHSWALP